MKIVGLSNGTEMLAGNITLKQAFCPIFAHPLRKATTWTLFRLEFDRHRASDKVQSLIGAVQWPKDKRLQYPQSPPNGQRKKAILTILQHASRGLP